MQKTELLRKYELMVIIDAKKNEEEKEAICREVTDGVTKAGGKIINSQVWLEKHKLAFEIKKCTDGTYYLLNFEGVGFSIIPIRSALKLNEKILRFEIIKGE